MKNKTNRKEICLKIQQEFGFGKGSIHYEFINKLEISPIDKLVLHHIMNFSHNDRPCNSQYSTIAHSCGNYTTKSIENSITKLCKLGLIERGQQVHNKDRRGSYNLGGLWINMEGIINHLELI